jgi:hypothetical protein
MADKRDTAPEPEQTDPAPEPEPEVKAADDVAAAVEAAQAPEQTTYVQQGHELAEHRDGAEVGRVTLDDGADDAVAAAQDPEPELEPDAVTAPEPDPAPPAE